MSKPVTIEYKYKPNPKQAQFHGLRAKYKGFCGGWGNGKTSGGCAEFFIRLMEYPGTNSIISRKTRPELRSTTWSMLVEGDTHPTGWRGIPKEVIEVYNKSDLYIKLRNGSQIHGLPLDDPKKLENYNLGLYMVDQGEEVEEEFFIKLQGRLRQHNSPREGLWLFNPNGHNWLWRRFINPNRQAMWKRLHKVVEATPMDNPNLPADYIEQFSSLPDHWYNRYVLGSHEVFIGQIFPDWNEDVHVIDPFRIPSHWERWRCIDPGIGNFGAVSWCARDEENNVFYYREIVEKGKDVGWWAEAINEAETLRDWGGPEEEIEVSLIGPEAMQRSQTDGRTVRGVFEEEGIETELADKDPIARINRITQRLRPAPGHLHPLGHVARAADGEDRGEDQESVGAPSLYVFRDCDYTVEHLPQYRWRPQRTNFTEEDPPEKVRKRDDHTVDNLGHILVAMGDSEPEIPEVRDRRDPEQQFLDEHFESELEAAERASAARGYVPGRIPSAV